MLTERENKMLMYILSGKMRRIQIYVIALVAMIFLIALIASFNIKSKILNNFEKIFTQSASSLSRIETATKLEERFKDMLLKSDKQLHSMADTLIVVSINWRIFWLGTLLFMIIINFWNFTLLERIIRKLQDRIREVT